MLDYEQISFFTASSHGLFISSFFDLGTHKYTVEKKKSADDVSICIHPHTRRYMHTHRNACDWLLYCQPPSQSSFSGGIAVSLNFNRIQQSFPSTQNTPMYYQLARHKFPPNLTPPATIASAAPMDRLYSFSESKAKNPWNILGET